MPRLDLYVADKWIGLLPKARKSVRTAQLPEQRDEFAQSTGRVDITDELRRYAMYRFTRDNRDEWFIDDVAIDRDLELLTQQSFEAALLSYLQ